MIVIVIDRSEWWMGKDILLDIIGGDVSPPKSRKRRRSFFVLASALEAVADWAIKR